MTEPLADEILKKIPQQTPSWAVGLTVIIVAVATSAVTVYITARDDISNSIKAGIVRDEATSNANIQSSKDAFSVVLSLVNTNSQQIVELSKSLGSTQQQNILLTNRVSSLEESVVLLKTSLGTCKDDLEACNKLRSK